MRCCRTVRSCSTNPCPTTEPSGVAQRRLRRDQPHLITAKVVPDEGGAVGPSDRSVTTSSVVNILRDEDIGGSSVSKYRVFISHKQPDEASAIAIRDALAQFSGDLEFFISGDNIHAGEDWNERLRTELRDSDLLLLLFTEPTRDWDWCLYEAGLFTRLDGDAHEPVVCIYPPGGEPPSPLVSLQGVPGALDSAASFVRSFIKTTDITRRESALNPNVTDEQITAAAEVICSQFDANVQPYYMCHRVLLDLSGELGDAETIPPDARILEASEGTMALFGRLGGTQTWGELVESHVAEGARWIDEINRVFGDACAGRVSSTTTHTFRAHEGAYIYRPELYRVDKKGRRPTAAVVMFTQEVAPARVGGSLFNRLRIAERYKTEVFERAKSLGHDMSSDDVRAVADAVSMIRDESKTFNVFDEETLRTSFSDRAACEKLVGIGAEWDEVMTALDASVEASDPVRVLERLTTMEHLNDRYRAIVAARYAELLDHGSD